MSVVVQFLYWLVNDMDVINLIRYTHASRKGYLKALSELPWDEVIRDRGASFLSIKDIFLHALDMEDRLINYVIQDKAEKWVPEEHVKFTDMDRIEKRVNDVEKKANSNLASLTKYDFDRKVEIPRRQGPSIQMRIEDVIIQVAVENISHMGELITLMWQLDKQPPFLSWANFLEQNT